ncbi:sensor domain-containing protein [Siculibacillus lacustris]|uniref:sensor domain-containing protein n=1 Tax=Siculibacillus lacustris TaxID=1549641 RepID=UPI0013F1745D|nr:EAL domain-containing protein [Siculibacillus lacustris]
MRTSLALLSLGAVLGLLPLALIGAELYVRHTRVLEDADRDLHLVMRLDATRFETAFRSLHQVEAGLANWLRSEGVTAPGDLSRRASLPDFPVILRARARELAQVSDLFVVDGDGLRLAGSRPSPSAASSDDVPPTEVVDPVGGDLVVVPGSVDGETALHVLLRLRGDRGAAIGAVVATVAAPWFDHLFAELEREAGTRVALAHVAADGRRSIIAVSGGRSRTTDEPVLTATGAIVGLPLVLIVDRATGAALSSWRGHAIALGLLLIVWEATLVAGFVFIRRQRATVRRADVARRRAEVRETRGRRSAEERALAVIFDNDAVGFAEVSLPDLRFVRVNRRYCQITGRDEATMLGGLGPGDVCHPGDQASLRARVAGLDAGGAVEAEMRYLQPDGAVVWAHVGIKVSEVDDRGRPSRLMAVVQDISALREAMERSQADREMLRLGMAIGHIATFRREMDSQIFDFGPEAQAMLGLQPGVDRLSMSEWGAFIPTEDRAQVRREIAEAVARRDPEHAYAFRFVRPSDGAIRHIETRTRYDYAPDGRCGSTGVLIDVTETRKAEGLLRLSLEIGRIGTFHHDFTTGLVHCDATTRMLYGLPDVDRPIPADEWFDIIVEEDRAQLQGWIAIDSGEGRPEVSRNYRIRRVDDGGDRSCNVRVRYEYGPDAKLIGATGVIIDVTDQREAEARIAHLARHDALTDLPNRLMFRERLDLALAGARRDAGFALSLIDLDHFKEVNDTLGHPTGDALLQEVTTRLQGALRDTDLLARLGGDEFAVIQADVGTAGEAERLASRMIALLAEPFLVGEHRIHIGGSAGIALAPRDGLDPDHLLKIVDLALYRAKADGRGRWRFFDLGLEADMRSRIDREADLRRGIAADEFDLHYQPIVDLATRRVLGFEALLRWDHPERGLIGPDAFLALAEETGVMVRLGARMLARACAQAASWPESMKLVFNLSLVEVLANGFRETVAAALADAGLAPQRLELELGERALTVSPEVTAVVLGELKGLGVAVRIDDFGTERSVLGQLSRFPVGAVKIDRHITAHLEQGHNAAIVRVVAGLCRDLGLGLNVEGVETEGQLAILTEAGYREAQGTLFGEPRPGAELARYFAGLDGVGPVAASAVGSFGEILADPPVVREVGPERRIGVSVPG